MAELVDAESHAFMTGLRLGSISSKEPVPPREIEPEIAIRFAPENGVMDAMHVRGDDEPTQRALNGEGQSDVAMVEHRSGVQSDFKYQHRERRCAQRDDDEELDAQRQQYLDGMKSRTGGHVHVQVGVVHSMEPPENGNGMKNAVLEVNRQVEQKQSEQPFQPRRPGQKVKETPAPRVREQSKAHSSCRSDNTRQHGINHNHSQIVGPPPPARNRPAPAAGNSLPGTHQREDAEKATQSNDGFVFQNRSLNKASFVAARQADSTRMSGVGRISVSCRWCLSRCDKPVRVERTEWAALDGRCAALRGATRRRATSSTASRCSRRGRR